MVDDQLGGGDDEILGRKWREEWVENSSDYLLSFVGVKAWPQQNVLLQFWPLKMMNNISKIFNDYVSHVHALYMTR